MMAIAPHSVATYTSADEKTEVLQTLAGIWGMTVQGLLTQAAVDPSQMEMKVATLLMTGGGEALKGLSREQISRVAIDALGLSSGDEDDTQQDVVAARPASVEKIELADLYLCGRPEFENLSRMEIAMRLLQEEDGELA
mmetsp:Transcript_76787/g.222940  ORF Transcript_76787/g.222940 Transcript_76787/m.222940 type:complete len:139 (-) Transcript_76787:348-764(-)